MKPESFPEPTSLLRAGRDTRRVGALDGGRGFDPVMDHLHPPGGNAGPDGHALAHAVRDGHLITGQQQYSGKAVAKLVIGALGV